MRKSSTTDCQQDIAIIWCNLGTPQAPSKNAVRRYLAEFLSDPRVVELPRLLWLPILHGLVLRLRPAKSAKKYARIWSKEGSPLQVWTEKQAKLLQGWLGHHGHNVVVTYAMRYGQPAIHHTIDRLRKQGISRILVLPAYPQYSATTTASLADAVSSWNRRARLLPHWRFVNHYHDHPLYIQALAAQVRKHWQQHGRGEIFLMSFHGIAQHSNDAGDPYAQECYVTAHLLAQQLELQKSQYRIAFQSRFGRARWLQPYTTEVLKRLASEGHHSVDVFCPGFVADCLETLDEVAIEGRDLFMASGGKSFQYISCLNDNPQWIAALGSISLQHLVGWLNTSSAASMST